MASVLPRFFVALAGVFLTLVLFALWQSLRIVLSRGKPAVTPAASARTHEGRAALQREKDELLTAIRDVRSEQELGKLSLVDSQQLEQRYRARARGVLRNLDEQLAPYRDRARELIEQAMASASSGTATSAQAAVSTAPATSARVPTQCAQCSTANDADAVFCKKCGKRVATEAGA